MVKLLAKETNIGRILSKFTTQRVITIVMAIMVSIPIFTYGLYLD